MRLSLELFLVTGIPEGFHVVRKEVDLTQEQRDPDIIEKISLQLAAVGVVSTGTVLRSKNGGAH